MTKTAEQEQQVTHTPTPWGFSTANGRIPIVREIKMPHGEASHYTATIQGLDRNHVCRLDFGYGRGHLDEVNAHLIVTAVNCHADLLAAAKHAVMEWRLHGQLTDSCRVHRVDRFASRLGRDQARHDLLLLIHEARGKGWEWSHIVGVLADVIDGIPRRDWSAQLAEAFIDYAGPYRLWETVLHVIAEAWDQEREREHEARMMQ